MTEIYISLDDGKFLINLLREKYNKNIEIIKIKFIS